MLPKIEPILPVLSSTVPTGKEWLYEPKLDGFRGVFFLENGSAFFMSKTKKPMPRFRELAATLAKSFGAKSLILDGRSSLPARPAPTSTRFSTEEGNRNTPRLTCSI